MGIHFVPSIGDSADCRPARVWGGYFKQRAQPLQRPAIAGVAGDQGEMERTDSGAGPWLGVWGRFGANRGSESPRFGAGLVVCEVLREKVEGGIKDECQVCHMDAWVGVLRWAPKRSLGRSLGECHF